MSEFLLDTSERRSPRAAAVPKGKRSVVRLLLASAAGAAALTGFAVAASSVMAGLVQPTPVLRKPAIADAGLASSWPDFKDGLPVKAGEPVKITETKPEAPKAPAGPRMAAFTSDPKAFAEDVPRLPQAAPKPAPVTERPTPVAPTARIPVPTKVAVLEAPLATQIVGPARTVATLAPRSSESIRARDEAVTDEEPAKPREAAVVKPTHPAHIAATPSPAKPKPIVATAKPAPEPAKIATAKPTPVKPAVSPAPAKVATAKPASAKASVTQTAAAEPDSDETEILGVKLPSLAPAGRKIKDSVSALGDAVRSAF